MSRRKVSVKDLGQGDCSGWLYKKKDSKGFLGTRWKKYWFVLKQCSLYWYNNEMAEKAEGYINIREFTMEQALEHKKKYAMKASHPQVMTLFFAAESIRDMNKWLSAFKASNQENPSPAADEEGDGCYSEASDHEETDSIEVSCQPHTEQLTASSINDELPPPLCSSSPCRPSVQHSSSPLANASTTSTGATTTTTSTAAQSGSWVEITMGISGLPTVRLEQGEHDESPQPQQQQVCSTEDEMEQLYLHLKQARLSPTGLVQPASRRDYRASFIRRCQDEAINEKLHLVRTLNSTLKSKEADLLCIEQLLADPGLSAHRYRLWREANVLLLQDIVQRSQPPGRRQSPPPQEPATNSSSTPATTLCYAETSV